MDLTNAGAVRELHRRRRSRRGVAARPAAGEERASTPSATATVGGDPLPVRRVSGAESGTGSPARPTVAAQQELRSRSDASDADPNASRRRPGDEEEDSLARRLASAGDQPDRAVCKYIVDRFDAAVGSAVEAFDERLDGLRGERDPTAFRRRLAAELEEGRRAFREQIEGVRDQVLQDVREALGDGYRIGTGARSVHGGVEPTASLKRAVDAGRELFRAEVDVTRKQAVREVHGALGGAPAFAGLSWRVADAPASPGSDAGAEAAGVPVARKARGDFVGTPQAIVLGHITEASLMAAAARGPESLAAMAGAIHRSPLRQAALETVGCDPVLVGLCAEVRDADCRQRATAVPADAPLRTLADDLLARHLACCREDPRAADGDERTFAHGRAALRAGPCGEMAALARPYEAVCRVEIEARLGRAGSALPADRNLGGHEVSREGRAWLERMRAREVAAGAAGPDRAVVRGAPRGRAGRRPGRRAQGLGRVLELADTRRGKAAAGFSSRLLAWGTAGGSRRLQVVGLVLGGSRHLLAGLVRAGADPIAVAAASSRGAARAIATGASESMAEGGRSSDHRHLVDVAEELDRRQRGAELTPATSAEARLARLAQWADCRGRNGEVPEALRALHADRHQALTAACARERDRAAEARRSGDKDFDLLRERVRDHGVQVWARAWRGRSAVSLSGCETRFDQVAAPTGAADGVKAMLLVAGGRVRHSRSAGLRVGRDLTVEIPEGLDDERRQSALIYGAAKAIVVARNPTLSPDNREVVVLSGMLASTMAERLDAAYEPPEEVRRIDPGRVSDELLRRGNALVQEAGVRVQQRLETALGREQLERHKEIDHQVDFIVRHSFGQTPRRAMRQEEIARERGVAPARGEAALDLGRGRG